MSPSLSLSHVLKKGCVWEWRYPKNPIEWRKWCQPMEFGGYPIFRETPKKRHSGLDRSHLLRPLDSFSLTKSEGPGIISEGEDGDCDCPIRFGSFWGKTWKIRQFLMAVSQNDYDLITICSRCFKNLNGKSVGFRFGAFILRQARRTSCIKLIQKFHSELHPKNGENTVNNGLARTRRSRKQTNLHFRNSLPCSAILCRPCFDSPLLLRVFHKRVGDNTDDGYHIGSPLPLPCYPQG